MKARDESGINKDFPEKSTDWIATAVKRCTDVAKLLSWQLLFPFTSALIKMPCLYYEDGF